MEVSGTAGSLVVSTRYDVAPDLDAVLVHTSFTRGAASIDGTRMGSGSISIVAGEHAHVHNIKTKRW